MALEFEFYLSPNCVGTNRKRYHARPTNQNTVDGKDFVDKMCRHSIVGEAETQSVLTRAAELLTELLTEGNHVHINGIGSFQVTLSCPETRTVTSTRAGSVEVKSVSFKPARELVETLRNKTELKRARVKKHSKDSGTMDILQIRLTEYFRTNRFLDVKTLEREFGLLRTTAQRRIRSLVEAGKLKNVSNDTRHPLYVAVEGAWKIED